MREGSTSPLVSIHYRKDALVVPRSLLYLEGLGGQDTAQSVAATLRAPGAWSEEWDFTRGRRRN